MTAASVKTRWKVTLRDQHGNVKYDGPPVFNTITDNGLDAMHACILSPTSRPNVFQYIAIGTSSVAPAASQTALLNEVHRLAAETIEHVNGTTLTTLRASFGPGEGVGLINEAGLFNAASGGTMLARVLQGVVDKQALDTLDVEVQFTLAELVV